MVINQSIKEIMFLSYGGTVLGRILNPNNVYGIIPRKDDTVTIDGEKNLVREVSHDYDNNVIKIWFTR